jgi:hypothetical protein
VALPTDAIIASATSIAANGEDRRRPSNVRERITAAMLTTSELVALPPPRPLIEGLLDLDSLAMMYGPPGVGKSFVAIDFALHVATGAQDWCGSPVTPGGVVYVVGEGVSGISPRVRAWEKHHGRDVVNAPMIWHNGALSLFPAAPNTAVTTAEVLADILAEAPRRPKLVVFDTLARCSLGADENSTRDMSRVIAAADRIREATRACVLLVHHSGKDLTQGARGNSALKGAIETELEVSCHGAEVTVKVKKQKNHAEAAPIRLRRIPTAGSMVHVPAAGDSRSAGGRPTPNAALMMSVSSVLAGEPAGLSLTRLRERVRGNNGAIDDAISALVEAGCVEIVPNGQAKTHHLRQPFSDDTLPTLPDPAPTLPGQGRPGPCLPCPPPLGGQGAGQG